MLRRTLIFAALCVGTSASVPLFLQGGSESIQTLLPSNAEAPMAESAVARIETRPAAVATAASPGGRKVEIAADARGHYLADFRINGRKVEALIDTGATAVAMNLTTARRLGVALRPSDLTGAVNTANGKARAAAAMLERVEIGRISVENVQAVVLEDRALDTVLIGMTFLNRLKTFRVDQGRLTLAQ
ncbi:retropepsin-like aspartic protease family protein [Kumtagia ephedrae]|uniref:TIGR02281 family clan AA aspartic protease n=1 Tax=Kumtagia ephedrae TaxID=2116701 RepID=A0A2P7RZU3_9HYPH|nr:TIGR02281 family clan AA aspartic protease [Mesorhizobium ephedrae]PSJ55696.1 TIGR02281 family clan AA aspartic protease [Mesorhizobium ephedrae]